MGGANKLILTIFVAGITVGIAATLITEYISKHVDITVTYNHQHDFH